MRSDRTGSFNRITEWANSDIMTKVNEIEELICSTLKMENSGDVYYDISNPDMRIDIFYVGANDSYQLSVSCFKDDKEAAFIQLSYGLRRPKMEQTPCECFYDFRTDKYYDWSDETIPVEKRRNIVFDQSQWMITYGDSVRRFLDYVGADEKALEDAEIFRNILA